MVVMMNAWVFLCIFLVLAVPDGYAEDRDLLKAMVPTDPTAPLTSGTGQTYHDVYGPPEETPPPSDEEALTQPYATQPSRPTSGSYFGAPRSSPDRLRSDLDDQSALDGSERDRPSNATERSPAPNSQEEEDRTTHEDQTSH